MENCSLAGQRLETSTNIFKLSGFCKETRIENKHSRQLSSQTKIKKKENKLVLCPVLNLDFSYILEHGYLKQFLFLNIFFNSQISMQPEFHFTESDLIHRTVSSY